MKNLKKELSNIDLVRFKGHTSPPLIKFSISGEKFLTWRASCLSEIIRSFHH